ncbi:MAG: FAD-dependent oxidoreductase [Gammaproteobacteria bacterium]|nr:FAD-dependent oxidoreductase [Gammaproteobacteria bacterium]
MAKRKLILLLAIAAAIGLFFVFDLGRFLNLEFFKQQQEAIEAYRQAHPLLTAGGFLLVYVAVTGLSLPGAAVMTLVGGAIFGLLWGTVIISFASTIGATLAFLASRLLLRDSVQRRFGNKLRTVNDGMAREGAFYLFALRLVPIFPFFAINLLMGLTPIRTWTFYWVSQVGMLAGTIVYVNAGTQLAQIDGVGGILSPAILGSFVLLALFPFLAKKLVGWIEARKVYAPWQARKPKQFEFNMLVIGAGSAGLVSAYIAAAVKAKVGLIERHRMGGDCLNTGCVPSKALIKSSRFVAQAKRANRLGMRSVDVDFRFADLMERVQRVIRDIEPHDSVERYTGLGVDCIEGQARITSPWTVEVDGPEGTHELSARSLIIAAGARPFVPPIPGLHDIPHLTSDDIWELRELPERLLVLGGGPIGCELTQAFARLGARVTQVEMAPRLMPREDPEISEMVIKRFNEDGIDVLVGTRATAFEPTDGAYRLTAEREGENVTVEFDQVLVAVGRTANTSGYGLEDIGVEISDRRTVAVNDFMQTNFPNIYACGDVAGPYQFTHTAAHTAWYASVNALFGRFRKFKVDYSVIPWATFTDPEVARVGLNETEARERGIAYEVTTYGIDDLDRAIADESAEGLVKVLTVPGKDKILGATIVGEHAGDLIIEFILAMRHNIGLNKILGTIHIYPTWAEANKYAAGNWKRAHAPQRVLGWLGQFHRWQRGGG